MTLNGSQRSSPTMDDEPVRRGSFAKVCSAIDRELVSNFTPAFFVTIMGTGISANILNDFPYPAKWLRDVSFIYFALSAGFLGGTTILFILACNRDSTKLRLFNLDTTQSVFMGCYAMGYNTLVNYILSLVKHYKHGPIAIFVLWWVAAVLSLYTAWVTFYFSYVAKTHRYNSKHDLTLKSLNITFLLPVTTLTVVALSGNMFALLLPTLSLKVLTMTVCFVLWANGVVLAFIITTIFFYRLFIFKIPDTSLVFTMFLPIGYLGQAAYGILHLGNNIYTLVSQKPLSSHYFKFWQHPTNSDLVPHLIGSMVLFVCAFVGLILISFAYFQTFLAVVSVMSKSKPFARVPNTKVASRHGYIKYFKGFWSMTFPLGVQSLGNTEFYRVFGNGFVFFRAMGAVYGTASIVITTGCFFGLTFKFIKMVKEELESDDLKIVEKERDEDECESC